MANGSIRLLYESVVSKVHYAEFTIKNSYTFDSVAVFNGDSYCSIITHSFSREFER